MSLLNTLDNGSPFGDEFTAFRESGRVGGFWDEIYLSEFESVARMKLDTPYYAPIAATLYAFIAAIEVARTELLAPRCEDCGRKADACTCAHDDAMERAEAAARETSRVLPVEFGTYIGRVAKDAGERISAGDTYGDAVDTAFATVDPAGLPLRSHALPSSFERRLVDILLDTIIS